MKVLGNGNSVFSDNLKFKDVVSKYDTSSLSGV